MGKSTKPFLSVVQDDGSAVEKREHCCEGMKLVLEYADGHNHAGRALAGIQVAHVHSTKTGSSNWSPVVCCLPSRGRGKAREKAVTIVVCYCPFCGRKQPGRPG